MERKALLLANYVSDHGDTNVFDNTTQSNWNRQYGVLNKLALLFD